MTRPVDPRWYRLRDAVFERRHDDATALVEQDPGLLSLKNGIGESVLHFLAVENDVDGVAWLHARGAELDTKNKFGTPALFEVAQLDYRELYTWFVCHGADPSATDAEGNDVVQYLIEYGNEDMAAWVAGQRA